MSVSKLRTLFQGNDESPNPKLERSLAVTTVEPKKSKFDLRNVTETNNGSQMLKSAHEWLIKTGAECWRARSNVWLKYHIPIKAKAYRRWECASDVVRRRSLLCRAGPMQPAIPTQMPSTSRSNYDAVAHRPRHSRSVLANGSHRNPHGCSWRVPSEHARLFVLTILNLRQ